MFSKPTVKSCFLACKKMFQAYRFHHLLLFTLSILSRIDNNFNLDIKILILIKIKRVGPSQYPHTHTSRPWEFLSVLLFPYYSFKTPIIFYISRLEGTQTHTRTARLYKYRYFQQYDISSAPLVHLAVSL